MPCTGQGAKRSGILLDIFNLSAGFPAPCDCYDDVVVPVGILAKIGKGLQKAILRRFPAWFRGFRVNKLMPELNYAKTKFDLWDNAFDAAVNARKAAEANLQSAHTAWKNAWDQFSACMKQNGVKDPARRLVRIPPACSTLVNISDQAEAAYRKAEVVLNQYKIEEDFAASRAIYFRQIYNDIKDKVDEANDSLAWADEVDSFLNTTITDYTAQLLEFAGNFIGLFSFVEKHQCTDPSMLDPETCTCTICEYGQLCESWKSDPSQAVWDILPQAPGIAVQDEDNICIPHCCGGSSLRVKLGWTDFYCACECEPGLIKRPCKRYPEGKGCDPADSYQGDCVDTCGENRTDGQAAGLCAPEAAPNGKVWSDIECDFVCPPVAQSECANDMVFSPYVCQCVTPTEIVTGVTSNNTSVTLTIKVIVPGGNLSFDEIEPIVASDASQCCSEAIINNNTIINTYHNYGLIETKTQTIQATNCTS